MEPCAGPTVGELPCRDVANEVTFEADASLANRGKIDGESYLGKVGLCDG